MIRATPPSVARPNPRGGRFVGMVLAGEGRMRWSGPTDGRRWEQGKVCWVC
jgi:hypothetical protein